MEGEDYTIDKEMFSNRFQELDKDLNSLHQLEALIRSASSEQIKILLHLVIDLITVDNDRKLGKNKDELY